MKKKGIDLIVLFKRREHLASSSLLNTHLLLTAMASMSDSDASDVSKSAYATRRQKLQSLVSALRGYGYGVVSNSAISLNRPFICFVSAQAELDLPLIAVTGNQSAGKSSLVEAISRV